MANLPQRVFVIVGALLVLVVHYQSVRMMQIKQEMIGRVDRVHGQLVMTLDSIEIRKRREMKDWLDKITVYVDSATLEKEKRKEIYKRLDDISKYINSDRASKEEVSRNRSIVNEINNERIKKLMKHVRSIEKELAPYAERLKKWAKASSDTNQMAARVEEMERINYKMLGSGRRVARVRTVQSRENIDDAFVWDTPGRDNLNSGAYPQLRVGRQQNKVGRYRTLIKINDIPGIVPKSAEIISAVLYLKQKTESYREDSLATINLYEVKKDWNEGMQTGNEIQKGECSWRFAKESEVSWSTPGLWEDEKDVDPVILATATGIGETLGGVWVGFYFNEEGRKRLSSFVSGEKDNYGWFLMQDDEENHPALIYFYPSETENEADRPYLEIIYTK